MHRSGQPGLRLISPAFPVGSGTRPLPVCSMFRESSRLRSRSRCASDAARRAQSESLDPLSHATLMLNTGQLGPCKPWAKSTREQSRSHIGWPWLGACDRDMLQVDWLESNHASCRVPTAQIERSFTHAQGYEGTKRMNDRRIPTLSYGALALPMPSHRSHRSRACQSLLYRRPRRDVECSLLALLPGCCAASAASGASRDMRARSARRCSHANLRILCGVFRYLRAVFCARRIGEAMLPNNSTGVSSLVSCAIARWLCISP